MRLALREVPYIKAPLVAGCWAVTTTVAQASREDHMSLLVLQFCFFLSLAIAFDTRDVMRDASTLRTLPQVLGGAGSRALAALLMLAWPIALVMGWLQPIGSSSGAWIVPAFGYVCGAYLVARASEGRSKWYYALGLDGLLLLMPLSGFVAELIS
jgi:hypothetical protein